MSVLFALILGSVALAVEDVPVPDGEVKEARKVFDASQYQAIQKYKDLYEGRVEDLEKNNDALRALLEKRAVEQGLVKPEQLKKTTGIGTVSTATTDPAKPTSTPSTTSKGDAFAEKARALMSRKVGTKVGPTKGPISSIGNTLVFDVPPELNSTLEMTVIPAGSYVKVKILTGVEANPRDEIPMLVQADHALVGPNKRRIDMKGCMIILKVKGDLSVDRVVGQTEKLSCIRDNGEHFNRPLDGYVAGEDSTFGVTGKLITRQGRVIAAGAIATLAQSAGDAVSTAQTTRQVLTTPLGGGNQEVANVDGSQVAYVMGSAGADASGIVADWYLKYADQLLPSIAVGSGRNIWVVTLETIEVPSLRGE